MLTKDLIRCRMRQGVLHPQFVEVDDQELLSLAGGLLSAYDVASNPLRSEIEELATSLVNGSDNLVVAKGLLKTVDDRAEFSSAAEVDYPTERMKLFTLAAELIQSGKFPDEASFRAELSRRGEGNPLLAGDLLFSDLPDNDRLTKFRELTARQVLERYNVGLVQGLLLRASRLTVVVSDGEASRLRRLMRYVKFFRLLAEGSRDVKTGGIRLTVDGPAGILDQSKRYGLQLAQFFPAVCGLKKWRIEAEVEWKERKTMLKLDEKSGLVCPYHNAVAWVPEEIGLFERHFKEVAEGWTLAEDAPFLEVDDGELAFPDFSFVDAEGKVVQLELFHRWHASPLLKRLAFCESHPEVPLIMGVDRWLLKDEEVAAKLEASLWFGRCGYFFRDYPTVEKTLKALGNACAKG